MPSSQYNRQMTEDYPVRSQYFSEVHDSLRSRPEDFTTHSQCREGNIPYLTDGRETDLIDPMKVNMAMSSDFPRVREYSAQPPRNQREYFPDVFWNMNRLRQTHQKPTDNRRQDEQKTSFERSAGDVPSKRSR